MRRVTIAGVGVILGLSLGFGSLTGVAPAQFAISEPDAGAFRADRSRAATVNFQPRLSYIIEEAPARDLSRNRLSLSTEGLDPEADWDLLAMAEGGPAGVELPATTGAL